MLISRLPAQWSMGNRDLAGTSDPGRTTEANTNGEKLLLFRGTGPERHVPLTGKISTGQFGTPVYQRGLRLATGETKGGL